MSRFQLFASMTILTLFLVAQTATGRIAEASPMEDPQPAGPIQACQPLPPPAGTIVNVSTVDALRDAVNNAVADTTILVADGTYNMDGVYLRVDTPNVTIRSASGDREAVILDGNYITTEIIQIVASDVTIADLTLREAFYHPIHVMSTDSGDTNNATIYNTHIIDPGEQAIKINPAGINTYPDSGVIACSHIELTDSGRAHIRNNCYTGGVDAHQAQGWIIRDNLIEGFWCESGLSEHGIHLWRGCRDTLIERNMLVDNARGIGLGLVEGGDARTYPDDPCPGAGYVDHYGGIIRNNFVSAGRAELFASASGFDCGICLAQACGARAMHNTVASIEAPFSSIEWRFDNTDVDILNNLVTHSLRDRGGVARLSGNLDFQPLSLFADVAGGDLHLLPSATIAIDQAEPLADVTDDFDEQIRPLGPAADIGADEIGLALLPPNPGQAGELNDFVVSGATPNGTVFFGWGTQAGSTPISCGGSVDISNPRLLGSAVADQNGDAALSRMVPQSAGGMTLLLQAVDFSSCGSSNLVEHTFP